jgi:hypothetical protein
MTGNISRLLKHSRVKELTHDRLPIYFGRANTSLLVHGSRCTASERLVNADGQNVYVTDENVSKYLNLPVALLHGKENALFNVESAERSFEQISRINQAKPVAKVYKKIIAEGYAHFDCTIGYGDDMHRQILTPLRKFYDAAWAFNSEQANSGPGAQKRCLRSRAKAPLTGPLIGWTRAAKNAKGEDVTLVRLWIEVDERESDAAQWVMTCVRGSTRPQLWPVIRLAKSVAQNFFPAQTFVKPGANETDLVAIGLADFEIKADDYTPHLLLSIHMVSIHTFEWRCQNLPNSSAFPAPITVSEYADSDQGQKFPSGFVHGGLSWTSHHPHQSWSKLISPINQISIDSAQAMELLAVMDKELADRRLTARKADPGTLSRVKRLSLEDQRSAAWVELDKAIFEPKINSNQSFEFIAASCRYSGTMLENDRADQSLNRIARLLTSNAETRPQMMWMLGDQIYADASAGVFDSPSPVERLVNKTHAVFGSRAFHGLTSRLPTYMVIDDHEIANDWSRDVLEHADVNKKASAKDLFQTACLSFAAYQWAHSPMNLPHTPGFNYTVSNNACNFFALDTRTQRRRFSLGTDQAQMIDAQQMKALKAWLADKTTAALPKFIMMGAVLAPGLQVHSSASQVSAPWADNWQMDQAQREELLELIFNSPAERVVLLAGDYHCCAYSSIALTCNDFEATKQKMIYSIVVPALYAPLPAFNEKPSDLLPIEQWTSRSGLQINIESTSFEGQGYASLRLTELHSVPTKPQLHLELRLAYLEEGFETENFVIYKDFDWT